MCVCVYSQLCLLGSPRSSDTPVARNLPTPRFYFQYHFPVKEPGVHGEIADSKIKAGDIQDEPGLFCSAGK